MTPMFWLRWPLRLFALLAVAVLLVVAVTATRVWWTSRQDDRTPADVAVVLGAAQFDGSPSPVFESRLRHAKELYDEGVVPRIITVGGSREGDRFTEAAAGERFLEEQLDVPAGVVTAVPEGDDTQASLAAVGRVMADDDLTSAVVVTDPIHSFRARAMARDLGIDAWASPARSGSSRASERKGMRYVLRETGAYLAYQVTQRAGVDEVVR